MYRSFLLALFVAALIWSGIQPREMSTWVMEVAPAVIWLDFRVLTDKKFRFTPLLYALFLLHSVVLMVGGGITHTRRFRFETGCAMSGWPVGTIMTSLATSCRGSCRRLR